MSVFGNSPRFSSSPSDRKSRQRANPRRRLRGNRATTPPDTKELGTAWAKLTIAMRSMVEVGLESIQPEIEARIAAGVTVEEESQLSLMVDLARQQLADADERVVEAIVVLHGIVEDLTELSYSDLPGILADKGYPDCRFEVAGRTYSVAVEDFRAVLVIE